MLPIPGFIQNGFAPWVPWGTTPAWLQSVSLPCALERRWASEPSLGRRRPLPASHVSIPSPPGHCIPGRLPRPRTDHVWLNAEACFIFRVSRTTGFLPTNHLPGLSLAKDALGKPHPHYKMWLQYFLKSSVLGTTNSSLQMSGDTLSKRCCRKIVCEVLCVCVICQYSLSTARSSSYLTLRLLFI